MGDILIFSNALVRKPYFQCSSRLSCEPCLHHFSDVSSRPPPRRSFLAPGRAKSRPRGAQVPKQGSRGPPKGPQNGTKIVTFRPGGSRPFFANCVFHVGVPPGPQKPQKTRFWDTLRGQFSIATVTLGGITRTPGLAEALPQKSTKLHNFQLRQ